MEDVSHLKIKIGPHEFEASGSAESVREQFQAFKEMIAMAPRSDAAMIRDPIQEHNEMVEKVYEVSAKEPKSVDNGLQQITKVEGRIVSLTARPTDIQNAILVILYGQKILRQDEGVTGAAIIPGLKATGGYSFDRIDRTMDKMARDGEVIAFGQNRGKRYRLTNKGMDQARTLAASLILSVGGTL